MALLELKNVSKIFGGLTAVGNLDMKVEKGQISALIGPNGAGKTTVFNMITGAYQVSEGEIIFDGEPIHNLKPHVVTQKGIARTFQNIRLFKKASVIENVMMGHHCRTRNGMFDIIYNPGRTRKEEMEVREKSLEILRFLGLDDVMDAPSASISYGHQRILEIGRALATSPKLLLLDEPAAGMNGAEKEELSATIRKIRDTFDLSVLIVEHDMELVMGIAEDITVVNFGHKIAGGNAEEIQSNEAVIEAYLGRREEE